MCTLTYTAICSLDGYIEDEQGGFEWAFPGAELHAYVNAQERGIGLHLYGRRTYQTMVYWETEDGDSDEGREYAAIWRAADKVVFSRSLPEVASARTRIERELTPAVLRQLKSDATTGISIGGADVGGQAIAAGLVDEVHLYLAPVMVGGGKRALPLGAEARLELLGSRTFGNGFVHLHYAVTTYG